MQASLDQRMLVRHHLGKGRAVQRGILLSMVLATLVLLSVLMALASRSLSSLDNGRTRADVREQVISQAEIIRLKLSDCAISYPGGNNGTAFRVAYPAKPASGLVKDLVCPGSGVSLWSGKDGVFAPVTIVGFGDWTYANDGASMRIGLTQSSASLARYAGMSSAAAKYGSSATVSGMTFTLVLMN